MNLTLGDIAIITGLALVAWLIWNGQGAKQLALAKVKAHCEGLGLQLLDDGIELRAFWFKRNAAGKLVPWRRYHFEFSSTGNERYRGRVILLGNQVEHIDLEAHRIH